ncbi:MAG: DNA polymerase III subunit gamma/tau [Bacteroidetes bacterium]|nr:DNA polymerase III subunit gamma/tau [Bacteroidota bacterium]
MENFIVSARKYRPATFDMVVGQHAITSTLKNAIRNNILAQAFLFCGPRGVGKTTCARIMAKTINCLNPSPEIEACDKCESCVSFNRSASFNIHELDAASNNSVEDIRSLVDQVRIPPQIGKYKIYIIDEVHMLSQAAFNAFLKTLEEPPAYAKFILATTEKHKIIPTILSRCQIFDFKRITVEDITRHLSFVADKEHVQADPEALNIIAQKADGALRDALSVFDQMVSFSGNSISYQDVITNLNVLDYEYYFKVVDAMLANDISSTLIILNEIIDNGFDGQHFIIGLGSHLRNLLVCKDAATIGLMEVSESLRERYGAQSKRCPAEFILKALELNNQCDIQYKNSNNKRLHLEITLLQICNLQPNQGISQNPKTAQQPKAAAVEPQTTVRQQPATVTNYTPQPKPEAEPQIIVREVAPPPRKSHTMSISGNDNAGAEVKPAEIEPVVSNAFDEPRLQQVWKDFIDWYKKTSPSFALALSRYEPELHPDFVIAFKLDNTLIAEDKLNMAALMDFMKKNLNNNQVVLKPEVAEKPRELEAYTDKEKFEKMANHRPMLRQLKNELNLETEF